MTIFDSIKYPISDPPTEEELTNLPKELYDKWLGYWNDQVIEDLTPAHVAAYYRFVNNISWVGEDEAVHKAYKEKRDILKRLIHEYDNL